MASEFEEFRKLMNMCFGCGTDNPHGLNLKIELKEDGWWHAEFVPQPYHCGWPGIVHGGILCSVLDEIMSYVPYGKGLLAVTARMSTDFKQFASPGERLLARSCATRETRRIIDCIADIKKEDGTLVAQAEGRFVILTDAQKQRLGLPQRIVTP